MGLFSVEISRGLTAIASTLGANNMAVYEVLYDDPFSTEYADVTYTILGGPSAGVTLKPTFASVWSPPDGPSTLPPRFRALPDPPQRSMRTHLSSICRLAGELFRVAAKPGLNGRRVRAPIDRST